jgi:predicted GIY-YIG superfamily endonuclease
MAFHTYILCCRDGSYYVGHTDDLERRFAQHSTGALGGYTARRLPVTFLWSQSFQTRDDAFAAERRLKGWSRAKKEAMMAGDWVLVSELARGGRSEEGGGLPPGPSTSSG